MENSESSIILKKWSFAKIDWENCLLTEEILFPLCKEKINELLDFKSIFSSWEILIETLNMYIKIDIENIIFIQ